MVLRVDLQLNLYEETVECPKGSVLLRLVSPTMGLSDVPETVGSNKTPILGIMIRREPESDRPFQSDSRWSFIDTKCKVGYSK